MRAFLVFFLILFSLPTVAADYTWTAFLGYSQASGSTPTAAASAVLANYNASNPQANLSLSRCQYIPGGGTNTITCFYNDKNGNESPYGFAVIRSGDSCPTGLTYHQDSGECRCPEGKIQVNGQCVDSNPCSDKDGTSQNYKVSGSVGDGFISVSGKSVINAGQACLSGCQVNTATRGFKCTIFAGEPGTYSCAGTAIYTGSQCGSSPVDVGSSDSSTPPPAPPTEDKSSNCGSWISTADGQSQTCVDTTTKVQPGTTDSGSAPSPNPSSSLDDTTTVTTKQTNSDGSVTTTTTKTTNTTYCTVGSCNTTTTTNTTVVVTDPAGNVTSNTTSCSGPNCGKPSDGTGNASGSGEGQDVVVGGGSGAVLVEPPMGNFDDAAADWDEKVDEAQQELRDVVADIKSTFTASASPNLSGGSGSLPCDSITVLGSQFSLCLTPYEGSLAIIKTILLFVAALIAFFIIFVRD